MSHMMTRRLLLFVIGLSLFSPAAFAGETAYAGPVPFDRHGVMVSPRELFLKDNKIWLRLTVINNTGKVMVLDKNQILAHLPDGRTLSRALGTFGKYARPAVVQPGLSHDLNIEYEMGPAPMEVTIDFNLGFIVDGKTQPLGPYVVKPMGPR
jgi:hypothetical protein